MLVLWQPCISVVAKTDCVALVGRGLVIKLIPFGRFILYLHIVFFPTIILYAVFQEPGGAAPIHPVTHGSKQPSAHDHVTRTHGKNIGVLTQLTSPVSAVTNTQNHLGNENSDHRHYAFTYSYTHHVQYAISFIDRFCSAWFSYYWFIRNVISITTSHCMLGSPPITLAGILPYHSRWSGGRIVLSIQGTSVE